MAKSHQSVNWQEYFYNIRKQCPWSYSAWLKGEIDIVDYQGEKLPLGRFQARVYVVNAPNETVEALAFSFDHCEDEWLFSYPGYGPFATPVPVLIQQNRSVLERLRKQLDLEQDE